MGIFGAILLVKLPGDMNQIFLRIYVTRFVTNAIACTIQQCSRNITWVNPVLFIIFGSFGTLSLTIVRRRVRDFSKTGECQF